MDAVVLVKVVPDVEGLRVDPSTGVLRRDGVPLYANPFDQRALRVALDLRRPGESVTVVSMGPPAALPALQETIALGADRAVLVTDRALAGSDSLITARVLAAAVGRLGGELVLMGRSSTDSETGQVPAQLAELLTRPMLASARRIGRAEEGRLEVDVDTETGWAGYTLATPAVISVGEKIAKIRKLLPEELRAAAALPVALWTIGDLGLSPAAVGLLASPTKVDGLLEEQVTREAEVTSEGSVPDRISFVLQRLPERLGKRPNLEVLSSGAGGARHRFLVLGTDEEGAPDPSAAAACDGIQRAGPWRPELVLVGPAAPVAAVTGHGAPIWIAAAPSPVDPAGAADALERAAGSGDEPAGIAVTASMFGRAVAGRLSARRGWGLTGDATGLRPDAAGRPVYRKPSFGGRWVAEIGTRTGPAIVSFRPGSFAGAGPSSAGPGEVQPLSLPPRPSHAVRRSSTAERDDSWGDLQGASLVLIAGMGVGGPEGVARVRDLARSLGGAVGASRRVVDLGWAPRQLQVGLTGVSIEPRLAVLVGVSGSANHLVGVRRSGVLLAVNSDAKARVFGHVDLGIVGDWSEVLPPLVDGLRSIGPLR